MVCDGLRLSVVPVRIVTRQYSVVLSWHIAAAASALQTKSCAFLNDSFPFPVKSDSIDHHNQSPVLVYGITLGYFREAELLNRYNKSAEQLASQMTGPHTLNFECLLSKGKNVPNSGQFGKQLRTKQPNAATRQRSEQQTS